MNNPIPISTPIPIKTMEMTMEEFIEANKTASLNFGEILVLTFWAIIGIIIAILIIYQLIKHRQKLKEIFKPIVEECPDWANNENWEKTKVKHNDRV